MVVAPLAQISIRLPAVRITNSIIYQGMPEVNDCLEFD